MLRNQRLIAIVRGLGARHGRGALVDVGSALERTDGLGGLEPLVGRDRLAPPHYRSLHVEQLGASARITLRGRDRATPQVEVETRYLLEPGGFTLEIATSVVNRGRRPIEGYRVGDLLHCGATDPFLLGSGWISDRSTTRPRGNTVELYGAEVSYAYTHELARFTLRAEGRTLRAELPKTTLQPGSAQTFRRLLVLGGANLGASLRGPLADRADSATSALLVLGLDERGEPLAEGLVRITRDGKPEGLARLGDDGRVLLRLPAGSYRLQLGTAGRSSRTSAPLALRGAERRSVTLNTGPPSQLVYDVRDKQSRKPLPVRVEVKALDGAQPWFGHHGGPTPGNVILDPYGLGVRPLPPGRYEVTISAGARYLPQRRQVTLAPHAGASVVTYLERAPMPRPRLVVAIQRGPRMGPAAALTRQLWNRVASIDAAIWPRADIQSYRAASLAKRKGKQPAGREAQLIEQSGPPPGVALLVDDQPFEERLKAFFALLAKGERVVALATSTVASFHIATDAAPRNWVEAPRGDARATTLLSTLRAGRVVVSNGPLLECAASVKGAKGRRGPGELLSLRGREHRARVVLSCQVSAAAHQLTDTLRPYLGGVPAAKVLALPGRATGVRAKVRFELEVDRRRGDTSLVVLLRGHRDPGLGDRTPLVALTNPIWIDANGDGRWDGGAARVPRNSRRSPPRSARRARSRRQRGKRGSRSTLSRAGRQGR